MILFETEAAPTLAALIPAGRHLETWTFDDAATRRAAEARFAGEGLTARCRSAYKPLLCAFREEIRTEGLVSAEVIYPRHPAAPERRFLLESYPLSALYPQVSFRFTAGPASEEMPAYQLRLSYADGSRAELSVLAPNRLHRDYSANPVLSPCGWRVDDGGGQLLLTDYESLFHRTMEAIEGADWGDEPCFEELNIAVTHPARDEDLGYGDEVLSLAEALHEDFYFSLLEYFQRRSGKPVGARDLRPGQIVPEIRQGDRPSVKVELRPLDQESISAHQQDLETAGSALSQVQIAEELAAIPGTELVAGAVSGRRVFARHHPGSGRSLIISAGQHANETSAPVGCLRAARILASAGAEFVISPLENPDGYALHQRLIADNPRHMHHAARYTALGDDLEYRHEEPFFEKGIRRAAEAACPSLLHVNCHGYPAHEWTRPLSGYIPRGFEMWTVPKGFFLILRHLPGWGPAARALMEDVTRALNEVPGLRAYNDRQIALFNIHAGETGFEILNGFPVMIGEDDRHSIPLTLITEYPDETVYGDAFRAGHAAQRATVLAAHQALQALDETLFPPMS